MQVKVKKLHPDAILPRYATDGAACFDLHCLDGALVWDGKPQEFRTGLSFEIPPGFVMLVYSRSGHGFKHGVRLSNCVGVIDSDFRGEIRVKLHNDLDDSEPLQVRAGDRIAQSMIIPVPKVELIEAEDLSETDRGTGGFGSTGV